MKKLHISDDLSLPLEFVTSTQAILAKKRVGKSYTASVEAEECLKAEQQICAIDPTGAWWGLKSSADGKRPGFPIVIFGGERADVPLEESAGDVIANALIEQRFSAIIDLSLLRKAAMHRFMAKFLDELYHKNREAMHLFVDEADMFAPQKPMGGQEHTLGAMEDIVRRGGIKGIGCTLITQRTAVINKDVLTQVGLLTVLRMSHPNDIKPINEWVSVHGEMEQYEAMKSSLPSLEKGTAWVWAPEWDLFKKVRIRERETFDSGATPKPGEAKRKPKVVAEIDLASLGTQIKATVERQKENDPTQLKRKIADLQKQVASHKPVAPAAPIVEQKIVEIPAFSDDDKLSLASFRNEMDDLTRRLSGVAHDLASVQTIIQSAINATSKRPQLPAARLPISRPSQMSRPVPPRAPRSVESNGDLSRPEQNLLNQLAELEALGIANPEKPQLGLMAGYTNVRSGGFSEPMGHLVELGLAHYPLPGRVALTDEGKSHARRVDAPLSKQELHERLCQKLGGPEAKLLREIIAIYPEEITKEDLGLRLNYTNVRSGGFSEPVGRLRSLGIIEYPSKGTVRAADWLFIGEAA